MLPLPCTHPPTHLQRSSAIPASQKKAAGTGTMKKTPTPVSGKPAVKGGPNPLSNLFKRG